MGEAKPSQHAGFVEICVAVCRPEFMARSSQLYYFMVSPGRQHPGQSQAVGLITMFTGPSRCLGWANPGSTREDALATAPASPVEGQCGMEGERVVLLQDSGI